MRTVSVWPTFILGLSPISLHLLKTNSINIKLVKLKDQVGDFRSFFLFYGISFFYPRVGKNVGLNQKKIKAACILVNFRNANNPIEINFYICQDFKQDIYTSKVLRSDELSETHLRYLKTEHVRTVVRGW